MGSSPEVDGTVFLFELQRQNPGNRFRELLRLTFHRDARMLTLFIVRSQVEAGG